MLPPVCSKLKSGSNLSNYSSEAAFECLMSMGELSTNCLQSLIRMSGHSLYSVSSLAGGSWKRAVLFVSAQARTAGDLLFRRI